MTNLMQMLLVLLLQSTGLLTLGLLALRFTHKHGPAVQTLIGRTSLVSIALLVLFAPLSGHIQPVWQIPTPQQAAPLPPSGMPVQKREGVEFQMQPVGVPLAAPSLPTAPAFRGSATSAASVPVTGAASVPVTGAASKVGAASSAHTSPSFPALLPLSPPVSGGPLQSNLLRGKEVGSWLAISSVILLWLAVCQWHLTRLRRSARLVTCGSAVTLLAALTPNPPSLYTHPDVHSPFLAGLRNPAILLPVAYETEFDATALRAILVHELAHRDRHDNAWLLISRLLNAVLWPQPLLWLLCRRLEHIREDACDEAVLASACAPRAYADCLLSLATRPPLGRHQTTLTAGVAPFRSSVGRRISRILTTQGVRSVPPITLRLRLIATALSIAAALGGVSLISSAPAQTSAPMPFVPTAQELRHEAERRQDLQNVKVIGLALVMYEWDNHYRFPNADHWMDQITPYLEQIALYRQDRSALYDPFQPGKKRYGYALNSNCSGKPLSAFSAPSETVAVFDSTKGTRNASDTGQSLRINASISSRINVIGSSYGFADGHAKWFRPEIHPSFSLKGGPPTASTDVQHDTRTGSPVETPNAQSAQADKTQTIIGYGLRNFTLSNKLYCRAEKNSEASRLGISTDQNSQIIAVNGKPAPSSASRFLAICHSAPPLRLLLKSPGQKPRLYTFLSKQPFSVLTDAAFAERIAQDLRPMIKLEQAKAEKHQKSLAWHEQALEDEVHQALMQGDTQTQAKALNLELNIGWLNLALQTIRETNKQHPERHGEPTLVAQKQAELKPLLA